MAHAHGPVHVQIAKISAEIARAPKDAGLHLRRGRAYLEADHPGQAAADFRRALVLSPELASAHYFLGQAELARGRAQAAVRAAERFLAALQAAGVGERFRGLVLLAQARAARRQYSAAADAYRDALALAEQARPEDYLQHAELLVRAGRRDDALATLETGLARLGSIITLEQRALELEIDGSHDAAALRRLERLIAQSAQPADLWLRKGELLDRLGHAAEANACYRAGLAALADLPESKQSVPALRQLAQRLRELAAER